MSSLTATDTASSSRMTTSAPPSLMLIMICNQCTLGGAEKRYARLFARLVTDCANNAGQSGGDMAREHSPTYRLVINRELYELLQSAEILGSTDATLAEQIIVLDPPSLRSPFTRLSHKVRLLINTLWYTWQCSRLIGRYRPAIVHPLLTAIYFCLPAMIFNRTSHFVLSAYSYQFENYRDRRIFGKPIGATLKLWMMQRSAAIDALSLSIREELIARGIAPQKIATAPGSFTDITHCRPALEREKSVVFLGRFVAIKQPFLLVEAIPSILAQHPDTRFYFLGEGTLEPKIHARLAALGVTDNTVVTFTPQPTSYLNRSSIFVSLQTGENYPSQSLLEAMACGNAIVATDVGESWRLVDEQNGRRVAATADAVATAVIELLSDPKLAARQAVSRERVLTEHTVERFLNHMRQVYASAMTK